MKKKDEIIISHEKNKINVFEVFYNFKSYTRSKIYRENISESQRVIFYFNILKMLSNADE